MSQQNNNNKMNSSNRLLITTNENDTKRRDLDDRDTGDIENIMIRTTIAAKQKQFKDKALNIIQNGIDKSKELLTIIKSIFKL